MDEAGRRKQIQAWDGTTRPPSPEQFAVFRRIKELARAEGIDWVYMGEVGQGTAISSFPPFQLMWFHTEPELLMRWFRMHTARAFEDTQAFIREGCAVIATGGDVGCDKGPVCSPAHFKEMVLPFINEHVAFIKSKGPKAVYTSDGNLWPIKNEFFFESKIDGYLEVDYAAGMTFHRLIEEGVADRVCIIGNVDQRHLLCRGTPERVSDHVRECIQLGQQSPGGHILHTSHSVHEDVKVQNLYAMFNAYREYFGLPLLQGPCSA